MSTGKAPIGNPTASSSGKPAAVRPDPHYDDHSDLDYDREPVPRRDRAAKPGRAHDATSDNEPPGPGNRSDDEHDQDTGQVPATDSKRSQIRASTRGAIDTPDKQVGFDHPEPLPDRSRSSRKPPVDPDSPIALRGRNQYPGLSDRLPLYPDSALRSSSSHLSLQAANVAQNPPPAFSGAADEVDGRRWVDHFDDWLEAMGFDSAGDWLVQFDRLLKGEAARWADDNYIVSEILARKKDRPTAEDASKVRDAFVKRFGPKSKELPTGGIASRISGLRQEPQESLKQYYERTLELLSRAHITDDANINLEIAKTMLEDVVMHFKAGMADKELAAYLLNTEFNDGLTTVQATYKSTLKWLEHKQQRDHILHEQQRSESLQALERYYKLSQQKKPIPRDLQVKLNKLRPESALGEDDTVATPSRSIDWDEVQPWDLAAETLKKTFPEWDPRTSDNVYVNGSRIARWDPNNPLCNICGRLGHLSPECSSSRLSSDLPIEAQDLLWELTKAQRQRASDRKAGARKASKQVSTHQLNASRALIDKFESNTAAEDDWQPRANLAEFDADGQPTRKRAALDPDDSPAPASSKALCEHRRPDAAIKDPSCMARTCTHECCRARPIAPVKKSRAKRTAKPMRPIAGLFYDPPIKITDIIKSQMITLPLPTLMQLSIPYSKELRKFSTPTRKAKINTFGSTTAVNPNAGTASTSPSLGKISQEMSAQQHAQDQAATTTQEPAQDQAATTTQPQASQPASTALIRQPDPDGNEMVSVHGDDQDQILHVQVLKVHAEVLRDVQKWRSQDPTVRAFGVEIEVRKDASATSHVIPSKQVAADQGSDINLVYPKFVKLLKLDRFPLSDLGLPTIRASVADGQTFTIDHWVHFDSRVRGISRQIWAFVSPADSTTKLAMILGIPWLADVEAKIDVKHKTITIGDSDRGESRKTITSNDRPSAKPTVRFNHWQSQNLYVHDGEDSEDEESESDQHRDDEDDDEDEDEDDEVEEADDDDDDDDDDGVDDEDQTYSPPMDF